VLIQKLNRIVLLTLLLLLTACVEVNSCPPIKEFTQEYRNALADELVAMQDDFPNAVEAVIDLMVLREQCIA
jgi:hypothetical protein